MRLRFRAEVRTDPGVERSSNEDVAYVDPKGRFAILADGMGGPGAGEVAAATTVDVVRTCLETYAEVIDDYIRKPSLDGRDRIHGLVERAVHLSHDVVLERQRAEPDKQGMGTTLEVVVVAGSHAFVTHVGDSRTYLIREGEAQQITADHTVAQVMKQSGAITESVAQKSPLRSVLSSAIGIPAAIAVDHAMLSLRPGDRMLVCSDGLHDYFDSDELATRLTIAQPRPALLDMILAARERGGHDNITGIVLEMEEHFGADAIDAIDAIDDRLDEIVDEVTTPHSN